MPLVALMLALTTMPPCVALAQPTRLSQTAQSQSACILLYADNGSEATEPTTPRSVEACLRLGIDPAELRHVPFEDFLRQERGAADLANLLYTTAEKLRQVPFATFCSRPSLSYITAPQTWPSRRTLPVISEIRQSVCREVFCAKPTTWQLI